MDDGRRGESNQPALTHNSDTLSGKASSRERKHVTTACHRCQQAKSKCDGLQPCERCVNKSLNCTYRQGEDQRRRAKLKRKLEQLQSDSDVLHDLLRHIRHSDDVAVHHVISIIRSGTSLQEVHQRLTQVTNETSSKLSLASKDVEAARILVHAAISSNDSDPSSDGNYRNPSHSVISRGVRVDRLNDEPITKLLHSQIPQTQQKKIS